MVDLQGWLRTRRQRSDLSPYDLRRTTITRALESGFIYRQVQMISKQGLE
jgi:hypothetical protein